MPTNKEIINKRINYGGDIFITTKEAIIMLNEARDDTLQTAIAHVKAAKSNMCLKDRIIMLREILVILETEINKLGN